MPRSHALPAQGQTGQASDKQSPPTDVEILHLVFMEKGENNGMRTKQHEIMERGHALTGSAGARPQAVEKLGYEKPSPIQMAAIPLGLQFRDVIGVAETGSGKTAAFVLPMLTYIMKQPVMTEALAAEGPYAVIMAPTRELALQIEARPGARGAAHALPRPRWLTAEGSAACWGQARG
jgi:ATP-dependent helicase YprA (DUF1998 family)